MVIELELSGTFLAAPFVKKCLNKRMEKDMQKEIVKKLKELTFPLASIVVALVLGAVILSAMGYDAGKAYSSLLKGAFGSKNSIAETLIQTTPLIFTALSYAIALRCGMVNLGAGGAALYRSDSGFSGRLPYPWTSASDPYLVRSSVRLYRRCFVGIDRCGFKDEIWSQ